MLNFRALLVANQERNAYGLRYNDNERYRKHCANKVHRLRVALKMSHGRGKDFKKLPDVAPANATEGHLLLFLFEAERLYAFAQELYATGDNHKAVAKHRRSLFWAAKLVALCSQLDQSVFSASALVEVHIYSRILSGRLALKKDDFSTALSSLCAAHHLLDILSHSSQSTRDQALASVFVDEISPEIRYCAHELKLNRSHDVLRIVSGTGPKECETTIAGFAKLAKSLTASNKTLDRTRQASWTWDGKDVPIRSPELVDVLEKVQTAENRLTNQEKQGNKARMAAYDAVLQAWSEASDVAKQLLDMQKSKLSSYGDSSNDAQFILDFVTFHMLTQRTSRDLLLTTALRPADNSSKPSLDERANAAMLKLVDTILQNLEQARSLSIVDESPDLSTLIETCLSFFKARRCLYLSYFQVAPSLKRYTQALALTQRAKLHLREAESNNQVIETAAVPQFSFSPSSTQIAELEKLVSSTESQYKIDWFVFNGGAPTSPTQTIGSSDNTKTKKPLFFDIALNYADVDMDSLRRKAGMSVQTSPVVAQNPQRVKEVAVQEPDQIEEPSGAAGSRLGSLLGSWWGRK